MWASRYTLPAPCGQQHRYLTQHVSPVSLEAGVQPSQVVPGFCSWRREKSVGGWGAGGKLTIFTTPALSKLMSGTRQQISSQPETRHFQINLERIRETLELLEMFCRHPVLFDCDAQLWGRGHGGWFEPVFGKRLSCPPPVLAEKHRATPWSLSISWSVSQWQCRLSVRKKIK